MSQILANAFRPKFGESMIILFRTCTIRVSFDLNPDLVVSIQYLGGFVKKRIGHFINNILTLMIAILRKKISQYFSLQK